MLILQLDNLICWVCIIMTTTSVKNSQCYIKMKKIYTYLYIGAIRSYVHLFHDRPLVLSMH